MKLSQVCVDSNLFFTCVQTMIVYGKSAVAVSQPGYFPGGMITSLVFNYQSVKYKYYSCSNR